MRWAGSLEVMAQTPRLRARDRSATVRRLLGELRPFKRRLVLALVLIAVYAVAQAIGPRLIANAIDHQIARPDAAGLARSLGLLFLVYVASALAQRAQTRRIGTVGQHLLFTLRERLFEQLQRLPLSYFDRHPIGDLISRVQSDTDTLSQLFSQGLTQLLGALLGLVGIVVAMLFQNVRLALVCFTMLPVMVGATLFFAGRARTAYRKTRETVGDVTADLQEEIVGVREAQAFNRTDKNIERFRERNARNRDANVAAVGVTSAFSPVIDVLSTLSTALVIGYGGHLVLTDQLTVGVLTGFLIYVQMFFRPVQLAAGVWTILQSALAGSERIFAILDEPREPADVEGAVQLGEAAGRVEFEHVSFVYESRGGGEGGPDAPALLDVSFTAEPGATVALVGKTGAGKTTIAALVPRFYDVTSGAVRIDGHDVRRVSRASLRAQFAIVPQEPFLFSGTVAENLALGREDATRDEVEAAARAACAHDFITALPRGYDTPLGEAGGNLSQGQRQLLAFARALLKSPRILILDEATANIDTRTESLIQQALGRLLRGRTSLVIAHRLSTIRHADLILVLEQGQVVERGTHDQLIARGGVYADLHRRQFRDAPAMPPGAAPA